MKNKRKRVTINAPVIQSEYVIKYFNTVDVYNHDGADYIISIQINRSYLRVFLWLADRIVFSCYIIIAIQVKRNGRGTQLTMRVGGSYR